MYHDSIGFRADVFDGEVYVRFVNSDHACVIGWMSHIEDSVQASCLQVFVEDSQGELNISSRSVPLQLCNPLRKLRDVGVELALVTWVRVAVAVGGVPCRKWVL
jgi:hypothetical protein